MYRHTKIMLVLTTIVIPIFLSLVPNVYASNSQSGTDCWDDGYEDGRDSGFDINQYRECGGSSEGPENNTYYNGFVAGCLSVKGNTSPICESAAD